MTAQLSCLVQNFDLIWSYTFCLSLSLFVFFLKLDYGSCTHKTILKWVPAFLTMIACDIPLNICDNLRFFLAFNYIWSPITIKTGFIFQIIPISHNNILSSRGLYFSYTFIDRSRWHYDGHNTIVILWTYRAYTTSHCEQGSFCVCTQPMSNDVTL